jgi:hypothetical protein
MPGAWKRRPTLNPSTGETTMTDILQAPQAIHIGIDDLPFVDIGGGNMLKVIHVD